MKKSKSKTIALLVLGANCLLVVLTATMSAHAQTEQAAPRPTYANGRSCPYSGGQFWSHRGISDNAYDRVNHKHWVDDMTPYNSYSGEQWCAAFAIWIYNDAGYRIDPNDSSLNNSRQLLQNFFTKSPHQVIPPEHVSEARPGDVVVWKKTNSEDRGHTGIVLFNDCSAGIIKTVEGNTATDNVNIFTYTYEGIQSRYVIEIINGEIKRIGSRGNFELYGFGRY